MADVKPQSHGLQHVDTIAIGLLILLGGLWSISASMGKFAAQNDVSGIALAFWQATGSATILGALCYFRKFAPGLSWPYIRFFLASGFTSMAAPQAVMYTAAGHAPAGVLSIMIAITPLVTYFLALLLRFERFQFLRAFAVVLGLSGAMLILLPKSALPEPDMVGWVAFSMLTPTFYAFSHLIGDKMRPPTMHPMASAFGTMFTAALMLGPTMVIADVAYVPGLFNHMGDGAIFIQMIGSACAFMTWFYVLRRAGGVFASMVGFLVVPMGIGYGWLFFDETHSLWVVAAVIIILISLAIMQLSKKTA